MQRSSTATSRTDQGARQPERTCARLFAGSWVAKTAVWCALGVEQKLTKRIGQGFMRADATKRRLIVTNHFFIIFFGGCRTPGLRVVAHAALRVKGVAQGAA